jgi:hypothetical protein
MVYTPRKSTWDLRVFLRMESLKAFYKRFTVYGLLIYETINFRALP